MLHAIGAAAGGRKKVDGVIHAAGILRDAPLRKQSLQLLRSVYTSKYSGILHEPVRLLNAFTVRLSFLVAPPNLTHIHSLPFSPS